MLRAVDYSAVAPFKAAAARDRVSIADTRDTFWFLWEDDGDVIGLCALIRTSTGGRVKGVWVKPEYRAQGHGRAMTLALIKLVTEDMLFCCRLEALAHNPAFYSGLGWKQVGEPRPNGAVLMARNY